MTPEETITLVLNQYQARNLLELFWAIGYDTDTPAPPAFGVLNTGDWLGEICQLLDNGRKWSLGPNMPYDEQRRTARIVGVKP
jgi:hypothetical protein